MGLSNQQQHQQQQQQQQPQNPLFGGSGQSLTNPAFPASGQYPPNTVNQIGGNVAMRDSSGNVLPAGKEFLFIQIVHTFLLHRFTWFSNLFSIKSSNGLPNEYQSRFNEQRFL